MKKKHEKIISFVLSLLLGFGLSINSASPLWAAATNKNSSESSHSAESSSLYTSADSAKVYLLGSKSLLLDPSTQKLAFGHGNKIPTESLALNSSALLLREIDLNNNGLRYDYLSVNTEERIQPAALTQLMTVLLILDAAEEGKLSLDRKVFASWSDLEGIYESGAASIGIEFDEGLSLRDLLYGSIMKSAHDASNVMTTALANHLALFSDQMNQKAQALGLKNTKFANPSGLHNANNYSTLEDLATIFEACMKYPLFKEILSTREYKTAGSDEHPEGLAFSMALYNYDNVSSADIKNIQGGKTAYSDVSHYSLVSFHEADGKLYLCLSSGAPDAGENVRDHEKVYGYLFGEHGPYRLLNKGELLKTYNVQGAKDETSLSFYIAEDLDVMLPFNANLSRYDLVFSLPAELKAPLTTTQAVGQLIVKDKILGTEIYKQIFTAGLDVKQSASAYIEDTYMSYLAYGIALLFLALLIFLVIRSSSRNKRMKQEAASRFDDFEA